MTDEAAHGSRLGGVLHVVVVAGALSVLTVSLLAVVLGALGWWSPYAGWAAAIATAAATPWVMRGVRTTTLGRGTAAALALVALAAGAWLAATDADQLLPRRDAGSNLNAAVALADTGRRIVDPDARAVGAPEALAVKGITLASPAFYQTGSAADPAIQPQFVIGPAAVYSLGRPFGVGAMVALAACAMALALLGFGLLVAGVVGARWGPVAAAALAIVFPVVHTGRATYSEPLAELTVTAGLLALVLAARQGKARAALLAVGLVGGTTFVRIDGLRETILLIPVLAAYAVAGRRWWRPAAVGAAGSTALAFGAALWLSYRYLGDIAASLVPLLALGLVLGIASATLVVLGRRGALRSWAPMARWARLPTVAGLLVVVAGAFLASRPVWQVVRQSPDNPGSRVVAGLQLRQGLTVDGGRTYAEHTVAWLSWWVGPAALVIALVALAALIRSLTRSLVRRALPDWAGPLVVASASTFLTLWRPGITPDHPWADRRLLIALPLVVALVVAAAAWPARRLGRPGPLLAGLVVAALVVPTALATWPHVTERVEAGSTAAVDDVCRSLHAGDVVLAVDSRAANEWPPVVRGFCGRPALSTTAALRKDPAALADAVDRVAAVVRARGGRLVLLAADGPEALTAAGGTGIRQVSSVEVNEDERLLTRRPDHLVALRIDVWLAQPATS